MEEDDIDLVLGSDQNELRLSNSIGHVCKYYDTHEFKELVNNCKENFSLFNLNIRSLPNKIGELEELVLESLTNENFRFSIIALQEIWQIKNKTQIDLEGFHPLIYKEREGRRGGGIGLYIDLKFRYETIEEFSLIREDFESLVLKVFLDDHKFKIIINLYRIPNSSIEVFLEWLNNMLVKLKSFNADEIILCGDLNINLIKYNEHALTNEFLNSLISHSFLPLITLPSRITENSANLLDNIFTNKSSDFYQSGLFYSSISDHLPVFYLNVMKKKEQPLNKIKKRNMSKNNIELFKQKLSNNDWLQIENDFQPESAFKKFSTEIQNNFETCFPFVNVKQNKKRTPVNNWMTRDLLNLRNTKDKLFRCKMRKRTEVAKNKFNEASRIYKAAVRVAKKEYYSCKFNEYSKDMKKTWEIVNTLVRKNKKSHSIPNLFQDENKNYSTFLDIAEGFNSFFVDVGPRLANEIPESEKSFQEFLGDPINQNFIFQNINSEIIYSTLSKLKPKNSAGHDNISTKLLIQIMPCIISPVVHLFNLSFKTGFIPKDYKSAKVIPIYKAGEKNRFDNYRPISILNAFSKLMEKIVACQMMKYLNKFNILYEHQYGFRSGRSTSQPLIQLINKVYQGLNAKTSEYTLSVFIDLKKAFDTCNISILLKKLEHYGFRGISSKWFSSYLTERTQYVEINGEKSSLKEITHGVPQGSVLGPILFLLYINDLPNAIEIFSSLFADDTIFVNSNKDLKILEETTNNQLEKAKIWFWSNKLSLNISKTKYIVFKTNRMTNITPEFRIAIGDREVERIGNDCNQKSFKFVGVHLDENMSWEHHINHVINKISSSNFALNQLKKFVPTNIRKTIYNSLVKPHIEYAIISWGNSKCEGMKRLITKQKQAIRNVANAKFNAHVDPLLGTLKILNVEDTLKCLTAEFVKSLFLQNLPTSFKQIFKPMASERVVKLTIQVPKLKCIETFPNVMFPKIWNNLDSNVRLSSSCNIVKNKIKQQSFESYNNFRCTKNKCYVCKKN